MRVLVTGAAGRLGALLVPELKALGHEVTADRRKINSDRSAFELVSRSSPDLLINLAATTDVARMQRTAEWRDYEANALLPGWLSTACEMLGAKMLHVSTDYALEPESTVYGAMKAQGERSLVRGSRAVRVALLHAEDVQGYTWLNGVTTSPREWSESTAKRLAWMAQTIDSSRFEVDPLEPLHIGSSHVVTVAQMVRERFSEVDAPVVVDPDEVRRRMGYLPPSMTERDFERWGRNQQWSPYAGWPEGL